MNRSTTTETSPYMTVNEASALLSLSISMVRKLLRSGTLTKMRFGRAVRVRRDEVEALLVAGVQ